MDDGMKATVKRALKSAGIFDSLKTIAEVKTLAGGLRRFRNSGVTPKAAHNSLISLFCKTGGASNDFIHGFIARANPPLPLAPQGVLGSPGSAELAGIKQALDQKGYYVFPQRLPDALCDRLLDFTLRQESTVRVKPADGTAPRPILARYERERPLGVRYDFTEQDILKSSEAQKLMADTSLLAVAQAYLGCEPILDLIACWWHTAYSAQPDKDAAQFFHFDMDRIKWLKFFFYITDVGPDNGPHTFVAGSHRTKGIPGSLLDKGMTRLTDDEVARCYAKEDFIEFTGPRGTIIAEDTRGLHKGKHVRTGDRLVFQLEFSDSLFGHDYPGLNPEPFLDARMEAMAKTHPRIFSRYFPS